MPKTYGLQTAPRFKRCASVCAGFGLWPQDVSTSFRPLTFSMFWNDLGQTSPLQEDLAYE